MRVLCQIEKIIYFSPNCYAASSISAEVFNLEQKKKQFFLVKKSWKIPCNSNNFQHIKKILRTSIDNLVLQILLQFQIYSIEIVLILRVVLSQNFKVCLFFNYQTLCTLFLKTLRTFWAKKMVFSKFYISITP